jgi:hypothetical protein
LAANEATTVAVKVSWQAVKAKNTVNVAQFKFAT